MAPDSYDVTYHKLHHFLLIKLLKEDIDRRIVLIDSGYGNNTTFLSKLDTRKLNYLGGIAKNRKITINKGDNIASMRIDKFAESLS